MNHKRILITEDDPDHRIILRHQLQRVGTFDILEATNGQGALDIVVREVLDLVILNLRMPVLEAGRWLAASGRCRALHATCPLLRVPHLPDPALSSGRARRGAMSTS
jgi:CheY-like chemotaxis protein